MKIPFSPIRVLVALCGVGTTLGVSFFVSNMSGPAIVAVPEWAGPNYAQDVGGFQPVTPRLIREVAVSNRAPSIPRPASGEASAVKSVAVKSSPLPVPDPRPKIAPRLVVTIEADRDDARPNGTIVYTIRVTNDGTASARDVVIESHVPDGSQLAGWVCDGVEQKAHRRDSISCGTGATPAHWVAFGVPALLPGATVVERFWVRIDHDVTNNTDIVNHAHTYASNADLADSEEASVIVR